MGKSGFWTHKLNGYLHFVLFSKQFLRQWVLLVLHLEDRREREWQLL